jgi:hypothetical protein
MPCNWYRIFDPAFSAASIRVLSSFSSGAWITDSAFSTCSAARSIARDLSQRAALRSYSALLISLTDDLKDRIPSPRPFPSSGNFLPPKNSMNNPRMRNR